MDFGEIRMEDWKRKLHTADHETKVVSAEEFRKRLKMFKRGDTKDVISSCCAQKCDGFEQGHQHEKKIGLQARSSGTT